MDFLRELLAEGEAEENWEETKAVQNHVRFHSFCDSISQILARRGRCGDGLVALGLARDPFSSVKIKKTACGINNEDETDVNVEEADAGNNAERSTSRAKSTEGARGRGKKVNATTKRKRGEPVRVWARIGKRPVECKIDKKEGLRVVQLQGAVEYRLRELVPYFRCIDDHHDEEDFPHHDPDAKSEAAATSAASTKASISSCSSASTSTGFSKGARKGAGKKGSKRQRKNSGVLDHEGSSFGGKREKASNGGDHLGDEIDDDVDEQNENLQHFEAEVQGVGDIDMHRNVYANQHPFYQEDDRPFAPHGHEFDGSGHDPSLPLFLPSSSVVGHQSSHGEFITNHFGSYGGDNMLPPHEQNSFHAQAQQDSGMPSGFAPAEDAAGSGNGAFDAPGNQDAAVSDFDVRSFMPVGLNFAYNSEGIQEIGGPSTEPEVFSQQQPSFFGNGIFQPPPFVNLYDVGGGLFDEPEEGTDAVPEVENDPPAEFVDHELQDDFAPEAEVLEQDPFPDNENDDAHDHHDAEGVELEDNVKAQDVNDHELGQDDEEQNIEGVESLRLPFPSDEIVSSFVVDDSFSLTPACSYEPPEYYPFPEPLPAMMYQPQFPIHEDEFASGAGLHQEEANLHQEEVNEAEDFPDLAEDESIFMDHGVDLNDYRDAGALSSQDEEVLPEDEQVGEAFDHQPHQYDPFLDEGHPHQQIINSEREPHDSQLVQMEDNGLFEEYVEAGSALPETSQEEYIDAADAEMVSGEEDGGEGENNSRELA
ncbi:unnamed protein product [Amoebophrya sp. A25]|nr:unnamed protein product [Amoebophrya sp. A25]|eukprot:GSA25T00014373001.1